MAIDDPVGIVLCQAEEVIAEADYLPSKLVKLGLSAFAAHALAGIPAAAQIVTSLLTGGSVRFERRLLLVLEELNAQQKRIENSIPDRRYYESEEFQSLFSLIIEKLHATHDEEKLRLFGAALANSGSIEFQSDEKEDYIRTLRDLSSKDLKVLNDNRLKGWLPHVNAIDYDAEVLSSLSRLSGMGLVIANLKPLTPITGTTGSRRMDAENLLRDLFTKPPKRTFALSPFGGRFLEFIGRGAGDSLSSDDSKT